MLAPPAFAGPAVSPKRDCAGRCNPDVHQCRRRRFEKANPENHRCAVVDVDMGRRERALATRDAVGLVLHICCAPADSIKIGGHYELLQALSAP